MYGVEPFAGEVRRGAVGEMAAGGEAHPQNGIAWLYQGQKNGLIRLGAGMRLHVGELAVEELLGAVDGELLRDIDVDAAAVVALTGIALGILVRQHAALGFHDSGGDDVFAGDQLDAVLLAHQLVADGGGEFGIGLGQGGAEEPLQAGGGNGLVHG